MKKKVLITGGAGFIGSHVADDLIVHGYQVRALDSLSPQVHGPEKRRPDYLNPEVELIVGDIRNYDVVRHALSKVDAVFHFAAMVGVGQSMYEMESYTSANNLGTAVLLEELVKSPVERLVIASSMSIYGEGLYRNGKGKACSPPERPLEQLKSSRWELEDGNGNILSPIPTPEEKTPSLASIYALSKYHQERMCLLTGYAYQIPTVALRFFNVYGTRQALSNPYTGVLAIFSSRLLNGNSPLLYEDGQQKRDFVSVYDVAAACRLAIEVPEASYRVFNIGSGQCQSILSIAERIAGILGRSINPQVTHKYRVGDIRHCFADISLAKKVLGYKPRVRFDEGLLELASWLDGKRPKDRFHQASAELAMRRLTG